MPPRPLIECNNRDLAQRHGIDNYLLQGSCQEVSYIDLAKRALIESLYRDLLRRSCQETFFRDLVHSCREILQRGLRRPDEENGDLAQRSFIESLNRDLGLNLLQRFLVEISCRHLV